MAVLVIIGIEIWAAQPLAMLGPIHWRNISTQVEAFMLAQPSCP